MRIAAVAGGRPSLEGLYREIVLDHQRRPRHRGRLTQPQRQGRACHALCGDWVAVELRLSDGRVVEAAFEGSGCAISQAAASMLVEVAQGKTLEELARLDRAFRGLLTAGPPQPSSIELGALASLQVVRLFPTRLRCALLALDALRQALEIPPD